MGRGGSPATGSRRLALAAVVAACLLAAALIAFAAWSPRVRLWRAGRSLEAGRLAEVDSLLLPLVRAGEPRAIALLARLRLRQGRPADVVFLLSSRLQGKPDADWLAPLGEAYLALGKVPEAQVIFRQALAGRPDDVGLLALYAESTSLVEGPARAIEIYERLERLRPSDPAWPRACGRIYMEVDGYELASKAFDAALRLDPKDVDLRFELAEADYLRGDLATCLANLDRCTAARLGDSRFETARAECLHALGRREEAARAADVVLARDPRSPRALRLRAGWHLERLEPAPAASLLERALEVDPKDWRARYQLALAYRKLGREDDARSEAERARGDQGQDRNRN